MTKITGPLRGYISFAPDADSPQSPHVAYSPESNFAIFTSVAHYLVSLSFALPAILLSLTRRFQVRHALIAFAVAAPYLALAVA